MTSIVLRQRLATVVLLAHPIVLLIGSVTRALRSSLIDALFPAAVLAGTTVLGVALWRRSPVVHWLGILAAITWLVAAGIRWAMTFRELNAVSATVWPFDQLILGAGAALAAAALSLWLWDRSADDGTLSTARAARRVVVGTVAVEAVLAVAILTFGFAPDFGNNEPWYRVVVGLAHVPGIMALASLDQCCGFAGGVVLSDAVDPFWGGLYLEGLPILALMNATVVAGLIVLMTAARRPR